MHLAGESVVAEVRKIKPYPEGNRLLSALHLLDIADKHKIIVPTISSVKIAYPLFEKVMRYTVPSGPPHDVDATLDAGVEITNQIHDGRGNRKLRMERGKSIIQERCERNTEMEYLVTLGDEMPLRGEPIMPSLWAIAGETRRTIHALGNAYLCPANERVSETLPISDNGNNLT